MLADKIFSFIPAIIKAGHRDQNRPFFCTTQGKIREKPGSTDLCRCVSRQQTHEWWRNEPCLKHGPTRDSLPSTFHLHQSECKWGMHRPSQRPCIDFQDSVMAAHAGLDLPAYITTLLFSASLLFMSKLGRVYSCLTAGGIHCPHILLICISGVINHPQNTEKTVICIYIRSLDQARGVLARGTLVFPSAVSPDSRNTSSGNLCTARICPGSLSTSKLSCHLSLSLSHPPSFAFPSFWSLFPLSHLAMP